VTEDEQRVIWQPLCNDYKYIFTLEYFLRHDHECVVECVVECVMKYSGVCRGVCSVWCVVR
jgi:hypothetical protein